MSHSPDPFHSVRVAQNSLKAAALELQLAEYRAHKGQIDEYKLDMYLHLLDLDSKTRTNLHLIQQQPEINLRMRPLLLDFLMDVINKLSLSKSTFPLTVNLIDRYCLVRIVKKQHYQLLGLTALWISCKNLDLKFRIPSLADLCKYCCHCYDKKLFLEMENHVLKSLAWLVDAPTFDSFIDMYIHTLALSPFLAGSKNPHKVCNDVKVVAIYVCELIQFYPNIYFNYTSPKIALVSVVLACLILDAGHNFTVGRFFDFVTETSGVAVVSDADYTLAFALLIKVLKCPPPSLKTKYFSEDLRFLHLMKLVVGFTWKHLAPNSAFSQTGAAPVSSHCVVVDMVTPSSRDEALHTPTSVGGLTTPKFFPATPVSLSISPKNPEPNYNHEKRPSVSTLANKNAYGPVPGLLQVALSPYVHKTLPLPNLLPADGFFGTKRSYNSSGPLVKRTKSSKAIFYIH